MIAQLQDLVSELAQQVDQNSRFICAQGDLTVQVSDARDGLPTGEYVQRLLARREILIVSGEQECLDPTFDARRKRALAEINSALEGLGVDLKSLPVTEPGQDTPSVVEPEQQTGGATGGGNQRPDGPAPAPGPGVQGPPGKPGEDGEDGEDGTSPTTTQPPPTTRPPSLGQIVDGALGAVNCTLNPQLPGCGP